ncbi:hypothetical protein N7532_000850, partial [Penicillium argentinense]
GEGDPAVLDVQVSVSQPSVPPIAAKNAFARVNDRLTSLKFFETRGLERVPLEERHQVTSAHYLQMTLLWFSTNITANNMAIGMLGPSSYSLAFVDSSLCATFGALLGAAVVAYMSTFGPLSGNRTMVIARYFMGYYPSRIACLLNIIIMLGYGMVDCVMTVIVGIIIVAVVTWLVVLFGMELFHIYESLALNFANLVGVGLASGAFAHPQWATAESTSAGALVMAGYDGLGGFGKFLGVLVSLGMITNNAAGT